MTGFDFSPLFRSTIGFDRLDRLMDSAMAPQSEAAYPPYNIEKTGENTYRIAVAVAGFSEEDLDVTVRENTLVVSGKLHRDAQEEAKRAYLHRGIAGRAFRLNFALADTVEVRGAELLNGLLHVDLERVIPESAKPRQIEIRSATPPKVIPGKAA